MNAVIVGEFLGPMTLGAELHCFAGLDLFASGEAKMRGLAGGVATRAFEGTVVELEAHVKFG